MKQAKDDPLFPVRADYRIVKKLLNSSYKVVHLPDEYDVIVKVFDRAGGSWREIFEGNILHLRLLKRVIRVAYKRGYVTRAPKW
jgi:hypothetical protein